MNEPVVDQMTQVAPYPVELEVIVENFKYKPGWLFLLQHMDRGQGSGGLTLVITTLTHESLHDKSSSFHEWPVIRVNHLFIVPAASYNRNSWMRWLLDRIIEVETHEACEFFRVYGERVYAPHHSEGEDPYIIWQIGDAETARKRFTDK